MATTLKARQGTECLVEVLIDIAQEVLTESITNMGVDDLSLMGNGHGEVRVLQLTKAEGGLLEVEGTLMVEALGILMVDELVVATRIVEEVVVDGAHEGRAEAVANKDGDDLTVTNDH